MEELSKQYTPQEVEDKWYKFWEDNNFFHAKIDPKKKPFTIVMPPPNITGILHMGHALNNTIQDILIRYHRMNGHPSIWMPGTDHAGIATQNVVEKSIAKDGLKRQDLGRDKFIEKVWAWKEQYGSTIIHQLKKLGASCDWERLRFTMDKDYSDAVVEVFVHLYEKGLIYQGHRIINWCPRCQTALSDEEAPHQDLEGNLYYLKYPLKTPDPKLPSGIIVATTRPETMLGDTAVAVNPNDKRYKKLVGKKIVLPLMNREIEIIADKSVDMQFGTGAVKVTPAHDPNDYTLGKIHNLEFINVMHPDARMNENAGKFTNLDRFKARELIIEELKTKGLLEKIEPHNLSAGHCYRCHTIIEPYLSKQWFVRMSPLAKPAIEAVKKGKIKFHPQRWTKVYLNWMENIQDWCISRQIWWGHRIPVYYCNNCLQEETSKRKQAKKGKNHSQKGIIAKTKPEKCPDCGSSDIHQEEDVLDTWFSSWLWPFTTFYWPDKKSNDDLKYFYPTSVLSTAQEIIFFWVARMIMAGFEFMKEAPFKDIYIHGTVRDHTGKKMSKSLGNIIDPLEIINKYGTDELRFSIISITAAGQDIFLTEDKFQSGRNFANKIWNASRFALMNFDSDLNHDLCLFAKNNNLDMASRWILSQFYQMIETLDKALEEFNFNEAANILYEFIWHKYCDWYLEFVKPDIKNKSIQLITYKVLEKSLRTLHPFMPFVTEEIWQKLPHDGRSIMTSGWPHVQKQFIDNKIDAELQTAIDIICAIRNLKTQINISEKNAGRIIAFVDKNSAEILSNVQKYIINLAKIESFSISNKIPEAKKTLSAVAGNIQLFMQLEGLVDINKEKERVAKEINNLKKNISTKETLLTNNKFINNAPKEIIEKENEAIARSKEELLKWSKVYNELS